MKRVAGMISTVALALCLCLCSETARTPPQAGAGRIQVVAGPERPVLPVMPVSNAPTPAPAPIPSVAAQEPAGATRADNAAFDALFGSQTRDPAWAPDMEAAIRRRIPAGGTAQCAAFMCRIAMPLPVPARTMSADRQADAVSRDWPIALSYNRLTASVDDDARTPMLIFYATSTAGGAEAGMDGQTVVDGPAIASPDRG